MKKVIRHETHITPWGKTALQVAADISGYMIILNMPAPFETEPSSVWMSSVLDEVKLICERATTSVRVGMMNSSHFTVKLEGDQIKVYHVRNEKEPRHFITISKV